MQKAKNGDSAAQSISALDLFFRSLESRISDPIHLRLVKAARNADPDAALEREFEKVIAELIREN
jgi:hypothetical protein